MLPLRTEKDKDTATTLSSDGIHMEESIGHFYKEPVEFGLPFHYHIFQGIPGSTSAIPFRLDFVRQSNLLQRLHVNTILLNSLSV